MLAARAQQRTGFDSPIQGMRVLQREAARTLGTTQPLEDLQLHY